MALAALIASKLFEMERSKYFKKIFAFPQDKQTYIHIQQIHIEYHINTTALEFLKHKSCQ